MVITEHHHRYKVNRFSDICDLLLTYRLVFSTTAHAATTSHLHKRIVTSSATSSIPSGGLESVLRCDFVVAWNQRRVHD